MTELQTPEQRPVFGPLSRQFPADQPLDEDRARSRISAYVYGNILVLAAVIGTVGAHDHDKSWLVVLAAVLTTYIAHIFAHNVGERLGRTPREHAGHLRQEIRDAVPILSSGVAPTLIFAGLALHRFDPLAAEIAAAGLVILRLAATGLAVERLSGRRTSAATLWSGIGIAVTGAVIALIKVKLSH
ncbi:hypothetical protein LWF15_21445 [Kineosporia rhizophila]|uniref:hypothetical protein n=1 Tax=Kineosporia TaxID=49184 RepID=UPI001E43E5B6|nr:MULTISPECIES: hypothetical protein [Kineosporia]MCE0538063.1 hypothetical protein [Kineosporia rhizophila]